MNSARFPTLGMVAWMAMAALAVCAQSSPRSLPSSATKPGSRAAVTAPAPPAGELLKEIDDPCTGDHWLLLRDGANPAGPARLVLAPGNKLEAASPVSSQHVIVHAGDALMVEEHTRVVDARLEATALGRAAIGATVPARLKIGGKIVRVVAVAPGRAVFASESVPEMGAWR